ncbi:hypothetical protein HY085_00505 [Candidatus Gottesmanbacteria bacterium]|nr:hypothetical protein [Candidatus Gottesmanbacteria bacterium]
MAKKTDDRLDTIETRLSGVETGLSSLENSLSSLSREIADKHNEEMNKLDSIAKMLETDDEERIIMGGQIDEMHEDVENLKQIHPNNQHLFATK